MKDLSEERTDLVIINLETSTEPFAILSIDADNDAVSTVRYKTISMKTAKNGYDYVMAI